MTVHVDIKSSQKLALFLELLKSLDFVEQVRVEAENAPTIVPPPKRSAFVAKHNGAIPHLDVAAFENHIAETRDEWEQRRNTY